MRNAHLLFAMAFGMTVAAACGGSTSNTGTAEGGVSSSGASSSGASGSGGSSSGASGGSSSGMAGEGGAAGCQCAAAQACCAMAGGFGTAPTYSCTTGMCPAGSVQVCTTNANCPTGTTCQPGRGGLMTCQAPPSCAGSADCNMGQVCCAGAAGAPNSCQTGTACPSGSALVCGAPTDCATGQVCCTNPGDAGGNNACTAGTTCPSGSTLICASSTDCTTGTVCCTGGGGTCQVQSACGMRGNRQICATSAECPAAFPECRNMACRVPLDGGAPVEGGTEGGPPADAASGG